jgi:hypothetical protein
MGVGGLWQQVEQQVERLDQTCLGVFVLTTSAEDEVELRRGGAPLQSPPKSHLQSSDDGSYVQSPGSYALRTTQKLKRGLLGCFCYGRRRNRMTSSSLLLSSSRRCRCYLLSDIFNTVVI